MTDKNHFYEILDRFYEYLNSVLKLYQNSVIVLREELESILQDDIESLNDKLKSQQVLLLQTKNFNINVASYLIELNIPARNLTEFIQQLPTNKRLKFYDLLGQFDQTITEITFYKEKCRVLLQSKLYCLDKLLSNKEIPRDNTTYNQKAAEIHGTLIPKSFETKI